MKVLGIRFCSVSKEAKELSDFFENGLGMSKKEPDLPSSESFTGAILSAGCCWIEVWPESEQMPAGVMLQIVVDDADEMAKNAKENGLKVHGPTDAHGERIYFVQAPGGLPVTFQSKIK